MRTRRAHTGFTLLEMMVVVAIVGVIAAMAVPNVITLVRRSRVSAEASLLASSLNSMRAHAIVRGYPTIVCLRAPLHPGGHGDEPGRIDAYRKVHNPPQGSGITTTLAGYDSTATPPDVRVDSRLRESGISNTLPTTVVGVTTSNTVQVVFDNTGAMTLWASTDCLATSSASRTQLIAPPSGFTMVVSADADPSVTQSVVLATDGTVGLP